MLCVLSKRNIKTSADNESVSGWEILSNLWDGDGRRNCLQCLFRWIGSAKIRRCDNAIHPIYWRCDTHITNDRRLSQGSTKDCHITRRCWVDSHLRHVVLFLPTLNAVKAATSLACSRSQMERSWPNTSMTPLASFCARKETTRNQIRFDSAPSGKMTRAAWFIMACGGAERSGKGQAAKGAERVRLRILM